MTERAHPEKKKLIVLYDGTWNDPEDETNVFQLTRCIKDYDSDNVRQKWWYDPGVGTSRFTRFLGGTSGLGLKKNLLQGYEWLSRERQSDEQIWIFGFSRGAYTARSLAGIIRKCGLLKTVTPNLLKKAYKLYRDKALSPSSKECVQFREKYARDVSIHFLGVWDTVGSLGVPGTFFSEKGAFAWHDTRLSRMVDNAFHAMALDEHRRAYDTALWVQRKGETNPRLPQNVEQRWFIGCHANVGGGYEEDNLKWIPLMWMLDKAKSKGLAIAEENLPPVASFQDHWKEPVIDSFQQFLSGYYGLYERLRGKGDEQGRFYRGYNGSKAAFDAVNVSVDLSVWQRWNEKGYRPQTLVNAGVSPESYQDPSKAP